MANKNFLEKMRNKVIGADKESTNSMSPYDDFEEDGSEEIQNIGDVVDSNSNKNQSVADAETHQNLQQLEVNEIYKDKQEKVQNTGNDENVAPKQGESIWNMPQIETLDIYSGNSDDQSFENDFNSKKDEVQISENFKVETIDVLSNVENHQKVEEEPKYVRKKPGPKPKTKPAMESFDEIDQNQDDGTAKMVENHQEINKPENNLAESSNINRKMAEPLHYSVEGSSTMELIVNYVCKKTVENLLISYESEIYTKKFADNLFKQFINGETDASNPLFNELILECIKRNTVDPYLGEKLTEKVLRYIQERGKG